MKRIKDSYETIVFGGKGYISSSGNLHGNEEDIKEKQRPISRYKALFITENEAFVASEKTEDKFVVEYSDGQKLVVFRRVTKDGKPVLIPFEGFFSAVWFEGKKENRMRLLWNERTSSTYKHVELKCFGIETTLMMKLVQIIFTQLQSVLSYSVRARVKQVEVDKESVPVLLEADNEKNIYA